jgi:hypothetical protein
MLSFNEQNRHLSEKKNVQKNGTINKNWNLRKTKKDISEFKTWKQKEKRWKERTKGERKYYKRRVSHSAGTAV